MYSCIFACAQDDKTLEHFQQYGFPPTLEISIPLTSNIKSMGDKKLFELYEKLNSHYKESSNLEKKMKQEDQKAIDTDGIIKKMIEDFHKKESLVYGFAGCVYHALHLRHLHHASVCPCYFWCNSKTIIQRFCFCHR